MLTLVDDEKSSSLSIDKSDASDGYYFWMLLLVMMVEKAPLSKEMMLSMVG